MLSREQLLDYYYNLSHEEQMNHLEDIINLEEEVRLIVYDEPSFEDMETKVENIIQLSEEDIEVIS